MRCAAKVGMREPELLPAHELTGKRFARGALPTMLKKPSIVARSAASAKNFKKMLTARTGAIGSAKAENRWPAQGVLSAIFQVFG